MIKRQVKGIIHWCDNDRLIRSVGRRIDQSLDNGKTFRTIGKLNFGFIRNVASGHRLGRRLARAQVKHITPLDKSHSFLVMACKKLYCLDTNSGRTSLLGDLVGSHPLRICRRGPSIFYGEYRSNPERSPINIWGSKDNGSSWESVFRFEGIRHIHGVFHDSFEDCFWVTTGDDDDEAAIWKIDSNWKSSQKVLSGSQQSRVIDLLFSSSKIFFGTDAPHEQNWIYSMERTGYAPKKIAPVIGTIFHAKQSANQYFFSTACEPGVAASSKKVDLLKLKDGEVETLISFRKDFWSMKYFQYGQIQFPSGNQKPNQIWISSLATTNDQRSMLLELPMQSGS